jgi:hypothetical protein
MMQGSARAPQGGADLVAGDIVRSVINYKS